MPGAVRPGINLRAVGLSLDLLEPVSLVAHRARENVRCRRAVLGFYFPALVLLPDEALRAPRTLLGCVEHAAVRDQHVLGSKTHFPCSR